MRLRIVTRPTPTSRQREQDCARATARADHHCMRAVEVELGDWRIETARIGVGADQRAVLAPRPPC